MADSYTQIYIHYVFAVYGRMNLISESNREEVERYISGIIRKEKSKTLAIYCNPDHIHVLIGLNPMSAPATLIRNIKANSSKWINSENMVKGKFAWQNGYGAFTYSRSQLDDVCKYILNQPIHHKNVKFKDEYIKFLNKFSIDYKEKYLFDWLE
jgi:REP element-mobilizing transposase RayT